MKSALKLYIISCLFIISMSIDSNVEWIDPVSGTYYNINSLKKDPNTPWKVKDGSDNGLFSMIYYFDFVTSHNIKCKGQKAAVTEVLEVLKQPTDTCEVLGKVEDKSYELIDHNNPSKGIIVTYSGGDKCSSSDNFAESGKPRKSKFILECSSTQEENVI